MRLLVTLIMLTIIGAKCCPIECVCNQIYENLSSITCDSVYNITEKIPSNVNKLILVNLTISDVDNFLERTENFSNLFHLVFNHCVIPNLSNASFNGLEKLQSLDLSQNEIKHLHDSEADFNLTNLKALDLSKNKINGIKCNAFRTLTSLEVLNLSANLIDLLAENIFGGLSKLQFLDISSNKLSTLHSDAFRPLSSLQHLNLSNNLLQVLDEACLSSLQRLQQLDVSWNRLAHVAPGSLQLPSLSRLLLVGNPALGEPPLLVGPGKRLQTVDASRTGLKQVPAALTHSIRTLRLAGNSIRSVSCGQLDSYPLLQLLDFTSNDLVEIEDDALGRLELLSILYLTDNKLRAIPRDLPERLKILHLEHNQISQIKAGDLQGTPVLEVLLLSDNKLKVVGDGSFSQLGVLATLDLSRNPISVLPVGTISGPLQLQVLRLSNLNVISPAQEMTFPLPAPERLITLDLSNSPDLARQYLADTAALAASRELQELNLSGNKLQFIPSDLLHFLPQLRILHLLDNSLNCSNLQWLATWLRRQDHTESRKVACNSPADLFGTLLVDLETIESTDSSNVKQRFTAQAPPSLPYNINATSYPTKKEQNVNEFNKPRRQSGSIKNAEITKNLFIAPEENSFNNESTLQNVYVDSNENSTGTTGKMSMFTEDSQDNKFTHPGMLMLVVGVLSASALMAMLASRYRKRRSLENQDNIEVSSIPSVTELW